MNAFCFAGAHLRGRRGLLQAQLYKQMPIYAIVTEKKKSFEETPVHLSTFRLRILFHMSQDSPLTTQVFRRREDRMGPEKASRPNGGKSPHAGDSQDVVFSRNQVI